MLSRSDPVRGVLVEELANARRRLSMYGREVRALPRGSLVRRIIKGRVYFYVARWRDGKVRYRYLGRPAPEVRRRYEESSKQKARYRGFMKDLRARIAFIARALHERKRRAA